MFPSRMRLKDYRLVRMSDGTLKLVRDLGRGWGGLRTFEPVLTLSFYGAFKRVMRPPLLSIANHVLAIAKSRPAVYSATVPPDCTRNQNWSRPYT